MEKLTFDPAFVYFTAVRESDKIVKLIPTSVLIQNHMKASEKILERLHPEDPIVLLHHSPEAKLRWHNTAIRQSCLLPRERVADIDLESASEYVFMNEDYFGTMDRNYLLPVDTQMKSIRASAPTLLAFYSEESHDHFRFTEEGLKEMTGFLSENAHRMHKKYLQYLTAEIGPDGLPLGDVQLVRVRPTTV